MHISKGFLEFGKFVEIIRLPLYSSIVFFLLQVQQFYRAHDESRDYLLIRFEKKDALKML